MGGEQFDLIAAIYYTRGCARNPIESSVVQRLRIEKIGKRT